MEPLSIENKLGVACSVSQADELIIWRLRLQVWWLRLLAVEELAARALFESPACLEGGKTGVCLQVMALLLPYYCCTWGGKRGGRLQVMDSLISYCFTTALLLLYYCFTKAVEEDERVRKQVVHIFRYYST